jgi:hypothetical protein
MDIDARSKELRHDLLHLHKIIDFSSDFTTSRAIKLITNCNIHFIPLAPTLTTQNVPQ